MLVMPTGYNRNSKRDLVANAAKAAQKLRIALAAAIVHAAVLKG